MFYLITDDTYHTAGLLLVPPEHLILLLFPKSPLIM